MKKVVPKDAILIPAEATRVFEGVVFDVYQWDQELFDGSTKKFEMLTRPDTVVTIGIDENKIILLNEEQPHRGRETTFPGGRVDLEDPSVLEAAKRELFEETGYRFADWRLVEVRQPLVKLEWFVHTFVAWNVTERTKAKGEAGEKILLQLMDLPRLKQLIRTRENYLGESAELFRDAARTEDLKSLPEFKGKEVDR